MCCIVICTHWHHSKLEPRNNWDKRNDNDCEGHNNNLHVSMIALIGIPSRKLHLLCFFNFVKFLLTDRKIQETRRKTEKTNN